VVVGERDPIEPVSTELPSAVKTPVVNVGGVVVLGADLDGGAGHVSGGAENGVDRPGLETVESLEPTATTPPAVPWVSDSPWALETARTLTVPVALTTEPSPISERQRRGHHGDGLRTARVDDTAAKAWASAFAYMLAAVSTSSSAAEIRVPGRVLAWTRPLNGGHRLGAALGQEPDRNAAAVGLADPVEPALMVTTPAETIWPPTNALEFTFTVASTSVALPVAMQSHAHRLCRRSAGQPGT